MAHGSYQHSYSGGGGCSGGGGADTSLSLAPSVTQQLSMQRDLSLSKLGSLRLFMTTRGSYFLTFTKFFETATQLSLRSIRWL